MDVLALAVSLLTLAAVITHTWYAWRRHNPTGHDPDPGQDTETDDGVIPFPGTGPQADRWSGNARRTHGGHGKAG